MQKSSLVLVLGGSFLFAAGCSILNAYDDVKEAVDAGAAGSGGSGGDAGAGGEAGTGDDAGGSGGGGGTAGSGGGAGDAASEDAQPADRGAIVVGGTGNLPDAGAATGQVLSVLDPESGAELSREAMNKLTSLNYDGLADVWYILEKGATAFGQQTLHARTLGNDGQWTELAKLTVPPLANARLGVLNGRIVYVAWIPTDAGVPSETGLVVIDTSNVKSSHALSILKQNGSDIGSTLGFFPSGLVASPNTSGIGGTADFVISSAPYSDGGTNLQDVSLLHANVPKTTDPPTIDGYPSMLAKMGTVLAASGSAAWGYDTGEQQYVLAFPPVDYADAGVAETFPIAPNGHSKGTVTTFSMKGPRLNSLAYDPCWAMVFVVELLTDQALYAVPTKGGQAVRQGLPNVGQEVRFEPYTRTVLRPLNSGASHEITAYKLDGSATGPTLTKRTSNSTNKWDPPADLVPEETEVKAPNPPICP